MKAALLLISLIVILLAVTLGIDSIRTVEEGHRGIQLRMGQILHMNESLPPGRHLIRPITDEIIQINTEARILEFDNGTIKWQVTHPHRYYIATANNESRMNSVIERRMSRVPTLKETTELNRLLQTEFGVEIVNIE